MTSRILQCSVCIICLILMPAEAQETPDSLQPLRFEGYPGAPELDVVPRKDDLFFYPCTQCHAAMEPNPEIRSIDTLHDSVLEHGRGRIWCLSCHDLTNRDYLRTQLDELVDFDEAHLVCGGCHGSRHKDWYFGANAHDPAIKPRAPKPPPPVRAGLKLERGIEHETSHVWERDQEHEEQ